MKSFSKADIKLITDPAVKLQELKAAFPDEWAQTEVQLAQMLTDAAHGSDLKRESRMKSELSTYLIRMQKSGYNPKVVNVAMPHLIRAKLLMLAMNNYSLTLLTGKTSGKVRLSLLNGFILQKLLFSSGFTRKPVSLAWFRFWWKWISQKGLFIRLLSDKGIYCFYSRELIQALVPMMAGKKCLEIAAGDGTLSHMLTQAGVTITATDNQSWDKNINYPDLVESLDAKKALAKYQPEVVLCSWPPAGNTFESAIFSTRSVQLYIVIQSRHRFASGNRAMYESQTKFTMDENPRLTALVIPPEIDPIVLVFKHSASSRGA